MFFKSTARLLQIFIFIGVIGFGAVLSLKAQAQSDAAPRDNTWGAKQFCRITQPVMLLLRDKNNVVTAYQTQVGDLIDCKYDSEKKTYVLNGTGAVQPQATVLEKLNSDPKILPFDVVPPQKVPRQVYFSPELRKKTQVMNEPDATWLDNEAREVKRQWVATLEGNEPKKMIFVRGSQIVNNFIDPYDQSDPACVKDRDLSKCDKRPELMYEVEVLTVATDKDGKPLDDDKDGLPNTYEQYRDKNLKEPEDKGRVQPGWVRSDFLTFDNPAAEPKDLQEIILPVRKKLSVPEPAKTPTLVPKGTEGEIDCPECKKTEPTSPIKTIEEAAAALDSEQSIMADLDQMRELNCGGKLTGYSDYESRWNKKYEKLAAKGKLRSRISQKKLLAIDAMARTLYGEFLWPKMCNERHWMVGARIVYNRAMDEQAGAGYQWTKADTQSKPLEDIFPLLVHANVNSKWQFNCWDPKDINQKKMGCVLNTEDWDKMTTIAARTVLDNGKAIKAMTDGENMAEARCYYSGGVGELDPCGGEDLLDVKVNDTRLIKDKSSKKFQCIVPQKMRDLQPPKKKKKKSKKA